MKIVEMSQELENVVVKHNLVESASLYKNEFAIAKTEVLQEALKSMDEEGRILKIGIVGRVKAGKSSLLNALIFNGENILPKAATPMTAALTIMEYSQETKAEVDFFTQEDLDDIKNEYEEYLRQLKVLKDEKLKELQEKNKKKRTPEELQERAKRQAEKELKANDKLFSSYDQYCRIKDSGVKLSELAQFKEIKAGTTQELNNKLLEFVGADGKYMPFTKSVTLKLNEKNLQDVQIIDTPGVNDPVTSREDRTKELLKYCDVVFIVSPSGQFLSSEDMDLFDRISSKEGINEVYIIASQVDNQLHGSEKEAGDGILSKVLDNITENLTKHIHSIFAKDEYLKDNPTFKTLLENKVIHSSGLCYSLMQKLNKKEQWDSNEQHVWKLLNRSYKDFFSDDTLAYENLKLLANMEKISEILSEVKTKKEAILEAKKESFIKSKQETLEAYKSALIKEIKDNINRVQNSDIDEIKKKTEQMKKIEKKASFAVNEEYADLIDTLESEIKSTLIEKLNSFFRKSKEDISDSEGIESESYTVDNGRWQGFKSLFGGDDRYETRTRTYTTVRAGHIRNSLDSLTDEIERSVDIDAKIFIKEWRKKLPKAIVSTLRREAGDENLEVELLNKTIRNIINSVEYPDISYAGGLPSSLRKSGTLEGSSAERFIEEARDYVDDLKIRVKGDIVEYISNLITTLQQADIAKGIFQKYEDDIQRLENDIKNKELVLEKYNMILADLGKI